MFPGRSLGLVCSPQAEAHTQRSRFYSSSGHSCMSSSLIPKTAFTSGSYNTSGYLKDTIMNTHLCHLKPVTWAVAAKTSPYMTVPMIHDQSYTIVIVCHRWLVNNKVVQPHKPVWKYFLFHLTHKHLSFVVC